MGSLKKQQWSGALLLFFAIMALYVFGVQNTVFIYDDYEQIETEKAEFSSYKLKQIFTKPHFSNVCYYRPICRLALLFEKLAFGDKAWSYRIVNATVLSFISIALYLFLLKFLPSLGCGMAFCLGLCFALHPISAQMVYIITCQEVLLFAFFAILHSYFYFNGKKLASVIFLYLAMLCRENAAALPLIILIFDVYMNRKPGLKVAFKNGLLKTRYLWLVLFLYLIQRFMIVSLVDEEMESSSLAGPVMAYLFMLQSCLFPSFSFIYEPGLESWFTFERTLPTVIVTVIALFCFLKNKYDDKLKNNMMFLLLWIFIVYLPTANLFSQQTSYANRHCMAVMPELIALLVIVFSKLFTDYKKLAVIMVIVITSVFGFISYKHKVYFKNELLFATQWLRHTPYSKHAQRLASMALIREGHFDRAIALIKESIKDGEYNETMYNNLGIAYQCKGQYDKAEPYLNSILARKPLNKDVLFNCAINDFYMKRYRVAFMRFVYISSLSSKVGNIKVDENLCNFINAAWQNISLQMTFSSF